MWIAKDKGADCCSIFEDKPVRYRGQHWVTVRRNCDGFQVGMIGVLPPHMYKDLKWEDEPIEAELVIKSK